MKALSVRQPWAHAILHLGKTVENRTWHLRKSGLKVPFDCLIHAGKAWGSEERADLDEMIELYPNASIPTTLPLGAIVGIVTITGCITAPRDQHDAYWFNGPFAFTMANPRVFDPIPCRGALGFFNVPDWLVVGRFVSPNVAASANAAIETSDDLEATT